MSDDSFFVISFFTASLYCAASAKRKVNFQSVLVLLEKVQKRKIPLKKCFSHFTDFFYEASCVWEEKRHQLSVKLRSLPVASEDDAALLKLLHSAMEKTKASFCCRCVKKESTAFICCPAGGEEAKRSVVSSQWEMNFYSCEADCFRPAGGGGGGAGGGGELSASRLWASGKTNSSWRWGCGEEDEGVWLKFHLHVVHTETSCQHTHFQLQFSKKKKKKEKFLCQNLEVWILEPWTGFSLQSDIWCFQLKSLLEAQTVKEKL